MATPPHVQESENMPQLHVHGHLPEAEHPPNSPANPPQLQLQSSPPAKASPEVVTTTIATRMIMTENFFMINTSQSFMRQPAESE